MARPSRARIATGEIDNDADDSKAHHRRDALRVSPTVVMLSLDGDEVKMTSARGGVARAEALYRANATADRSSDAFLAERRRESWGSS